MNIPALSSLERHVGRFRLLAGALNDYARIGLRLMTGEKLTQENFSGWWQTYRDAKAHVWYWRERLQCELGEVLAQLYLSPPRPKPDEMEAWLRGRREALPLLNSEVIARVEVELRKQSPEIEAKIRLRAVNHFSTALGMELDEPLLGPFTTSREQVWMAFTNEKSNGESLARARKIMLEIFSMPADGRQ